MADVGAFGALVHDITTEATMAVFAGVGDGSEALLARAIVARLTVKAVRIRVALVRSQRAFIRVTTDKPVADEARRRASTREAAIAVGASCTWVAWARLASGDDGTLVDI
jgi:hypothetical protein